VTRYDSKFRALAFAFAALAGFVDAIGYLKSGGLFVSFMSGNSTRLAVDLAGLRAAGLSAAALIALFVLGVTGNVFLSAGRLTERRKVVAASVVAALLISAALFQAAGWEIATIGALCVAMGASNAVFQRDGEVSIGVTYMTGTLVKLGYKLSDALAGKDTKAWQPYLALWLSLVVGGVTGGAFYAKYAGLSIAFAAAIAIALAAICAWLTRE